MPSKTGPKMLTCQDTDDPDHWARRLRIASEGDCYRLIAEMSGLALRLHGKGIPAPGPEARLEEGESIFLERFGHRTTPF